jgi:chromosomal replication initiator protein
MDTLKSVCDMVLANLKHKFAPTVYSLWFEDLVLTELGESHAVFSINSNFKKSTLEKHYKAAVELSMSEVMGFAVEISFHSSEGEEGVKTPLDTIREKEKEQEEELRRAKEKEEAQISSKIESQSIIEDYNFGNFVVGDSNKFAYAACYAVSQDPFNAYNPLFIFGPSGLGKTHLLFAITNEIKRKKPNVRIVYKKGEEFTNELIDHLKSGEMQRFREKYRSTDVLLIDDIQFIAGKTSTQEEFFHTFSTLYENRKQIIITSDRPPKEINPLEERLRTRFEWGLLADIQPPSEELRIAIIRQKAEDLNISIPEDAITFLSGSLQKNIRQIEGAIKKISAVSTISGSPITLDMCRRAIADIVNGNEPSPVTVDRILNIVADNYGVSVDELKGSKRNANIATARHMCMYLLRHHTQLSLTEIGKIFSRDHSTTISSIRKVEEERKEEPVTFTLIGELNRKITAEN